MRCAFLKILSPDLELSKKQREEDGSFSSPDIDCVLSLVFPCQLPLNAFFLSSTLSHDPHADFRLVN